MPSRICLSTNDDIRIEHVLVFKWYPAIPTHDLNILGCWFGRNNSCTYYRFHHRIIIIDAVDHVIYPSPFLPSPTSQGWASSPSAGIAYNKVTWYFTCNVNISITELWDALYTRNQYQYHPFGSDMYKMFEFYCIHQYTSPFSWRIVSSPWYDPRCYYKIWDGITFHPYFSSTYYITTRHYRLFYK